jgi:hypothetical protein
MALPSDYKDPNIITPKNYEKRNIVQSGMIPDKFINRRKSGELTDETEAFKDPYPRSYKARCANAFEFDNVIRPGIVTLVNYILKGDLRIECIPTNRAAKETPEELKQALDDVLEESSRNKMMDFITHVDQLCKLKRKLRPALVQKFVFGRSATFIERADKSIEQKAELAELGFKEGAPIYLKPLNSYWLGQIHVDTVSWEPISVDYDDEKWTREPEGTSEDAQPPIAMEDLLYFTNDDYAVAPNSYNYGLSMIQNIMALSGANRRLNEKVLPELNTSAYAGSGIFKFEGMTAADMKNFVDTVLPATLKATNQAVSFEQIKIDANMQDIISQRDSNVKHEAMCIRIPSFLINFENITNRATTEQVSNVWQQTVLEPAREELREELWEQWYQPLIEFFYPDSEFLYLRLKVQNVFESVDFSSLIDKAAAVKDLYNSNLLTIREAREILARPPFPPDQEELVDKVKNFMANNPNRFLQPEEQEQMNNQAMDEQEQQEKNPLPFQRRAQTNTINRNRRQ